MTRSGTENGAMGWYNARQCNKLGTGDKGVGYAVKSAINIKIYVRGDLPKCGM